MVPGTAAFSAARGHSRSPTSGQFTTISNFDGSTLAKGRQESAAEDRLLEPGLRDSAGWASPGDLAIVSPGDPAQAHRLIEDALLKLRDVLAEARSRGASIWFMSDFPLFRFPVLAASSLLADAETVRLRLVSDEFAVQCVLPIIKTMCSAETVSRFASRSRALLQQFAETDATDVSGREQVRLVNRAERTVAGRALQQLGPVFCMWWTRGSAVSLSKGFRQRKFPTRRFWPTSLLAVWLAWRDTTRSK